jgi:hypothetical protein
MRSLTGEEARNVIAAAQADEELGSLWMLGLTT